MLNPLDEAEVKELIEFRLMHAGYSSRYLLFTDGAINMIYNYTQGYPRRIAMLCHDALEYLVMHNKELVTDKVIQELVHDDMRQFGKNRESGCLKT
jgi:type II secretory pathway predicted ATPase ExeA